MGTGVQPSLLLEREDDLARISGSLEQARDGRGTLLVVEGPAGVGKTALLAEARAIAESSGMQVLRSRGAELEREFAFGVVRQLLEPVLRGVDDPEGLFQGPAGVAAGLLGLPGAPAHDGAAFADQDSSFAVLHGLYWLCADLAGRQPLCVLVDDAHWADAPSLRFLSFLVPRLEELPVAPCVGARPREAREQAALLESLAADGAAWAVTPAPLTAAGVAELLTLELGAAPGPAFAGACHRATGGLPFLVRQVVAGLRRAGSRPPRPPPRSWSASAAGPWGGGCWCAWTGCRPPPGGSPARSPCSRPRDLAQAAALAEVSADDCRGGGGHARGSRHPRPRDGRSRSPTP